MKKSRSELCLLFMIVILSGCAKKNAFDLISAYKRPERDINQIIKKKYGTDDLYRQNMINLKNGYPFYVLRTNTPLLSEKPSETAMLPGDHVKLGFGDVVFPMPEENPQKYYFRVRTVTGITGWVHSSFGVSLNYNEDPNLYYFNEGYYLKRYKESGGAIDSSSKVILAKNAVPMLLDNYETQGWFYPEDTDLALEICLYIDKIAQPRDTFFYSATNLFDWRVNEFVISKNLLADTYHKLGFFTKAEEIHQELMKYHFWSRADNCPIGGLNSIVKLEKTYLEQLKHERIGTKNYEQLQNKIIETILVIGDKYNKYTMIDPKWQLTGAEWVLSILIKSVTVEEFYDFAAKIRKQTASPGYAEMVNIYLALEMYKDGRGEEAMKILTSIKPKENYKVSLKINDWLSANKMIPDSIIYQYKF